MYIPIFGVRRCILLQVWIIYTVDVMSRRDDIRHFGYADELDSLGAAVGRQRQIRRLAAKILHQELRLPGAEDRRVIFYFICK